MEQESGSKQFTDQLQGSALQDQAVRAFSPNRLSLYAVDEPSQFDRLVLDYGDHVVKGYADRRQWSVEENRAPTRISVLPLGSSSIEDMPLDGMKSVSFVKSFDTVDHHELRFHDHLAPAECLWVRLTFTDGEMLEGMIRNERDHILRGGFYMSPADQQGNSMLIYVFKHKLSDFQVLGLRPACKSLAGVGQRAI